MNTRIAAVLLCLIAPMAAFAGGKSGRFDTPAVTCGTASGASIAVVVKAGPSGASAGFSVQWISTADYDAFGWENASTLAPSYCAASFSGNANGSNYNLGPNESIAVKIGEMLLDSGASTSCNFALDCGRTYVFRTFAHATSTTNRSEFSQGTSCSTLACAPVGCTYTQAYWKTHLVPGTTITLGNVIYSDAQMLAILSMTPPASDGLVSLADQLIAAKLNIANGADASAIAPTVASADALIGDLVIGVDSVPPAVTSTLTAALTSYNEGATGPGHCSDEVPPDPGLD